MSKSKVAILIPCEVFDVEVILGPQRGLSVIEELTLKAIREGTRHLDGLVDLFQIGRRPTLDLMAGLWRRGYLHVDLSRGDLSLADDVEMMLRTGDLTQLEGGERQQKTVQLMQDLVSGQVLPLERTMHAPGNSLAPELLAPGSYRRPERWPEIVAQLRRLETSWRRDRRSRVLAASLGVGDLADEGSREQRLLKLDARVGRTEAGFIDVKLAHQRGFGARARRALERRLERLLEEDPEHPFCRYLSNQIDSQAPLAENLAKPNLLSEVDEQIAKLLAPELSYEIRAAVTREYQARLLECTETIRLVLQEREEERVGIRWIIGDQALLEAVRTTIDAAQKKIVISAPAIDAEQLVQLVGSIEKAMQRGVEIFLLWGRLWEEELPERVVAMFQLLGERGLFHYSLRPARSSARFVLCDGDVGIFSHGSFLAPWPSATVVSAEVRGIEEGQTLPLIEEALDRAATIFPGDYQLVERLGSKVRRKGSPLRQAQASDPAGNGLNDDELADIPSLPHIGDFEEAHAAGAWEAWREEWLEVLRSLRRNLQQEKTTGTIIHDSRHRWLMMDALRHARHFVVIASGQISTDGLDLQLEDLIVECAKRGVQVLLVYDRVREPAIRDRIKKLRQMALDSLALKQLSWQGGLLLVDDQALVTSFDFLSLPGGIQPSNRRVYETGILVHGRKVVADLVEVLRDSLEGVFDRLDFGGHVDVDLSEPTETTDRSRALQQHKKLLQALRHGRPARSRTNAVLPETALNLEQTYFRWLEFLFEAGEEIDLDALMPFIPENEREIMVGALLTLPTALEAQDRTRWLVWLATRAWWREPEEAGNVDLWELSFLMAEIGDHPVSNSLPPLWLARLRAIESVPHRNSMVDRAWQEELATTFESARIDNFGAIGAALLLCDVLAIRGWNSAAPVLREISELLEDGAVRECCTVALKYWQTTSLPLAKLLTLERADAALLQESSAQLKALRTSYTQIRAINFKFPTGTRIWQSLLQMPEMRLLANALQEADFHSLKRVLDDVTDPISLLELTTDTLNQENPRLNASIESVKRRSCEGKLRKLWSAAHEWVQSATSPAPVGDQAGDQRMVMLGREAKREVGPIVESLRELTCRWKEERLFLAPLGQSLVDGLSPFFPSLDSEDLR